MKETETLLSKKAAHYENKKVSTRDIYDESIKH